MLDTCKVCGKSFYGDSGEVPKLISAHVKREHEQGYRRVDSWQKCHYCGGRGKDTNGITCSYCNGSGIE